MLLGVVLFATLACAAPRGTRPPEVPISARAGQPVRPAWPVLSRVIVQVNDDYFDPTRIDPRRMVLGALMAVDQAIDEVVVARSETSSMVTITVGPAVQELDLSEVRTIWEVRTLFGKAMAFLQDRLPERGDLGTIEYAAVNGMLATLDPQTVLIEPKAFKELMTQSGAGGLGGIGLVLARRDGALTVVRTTRGGPAERAGLARHDVITEIDRNSVEGVDLPRVSEMLRGEIGTVVAITFVRPGEAPSRIMIGRAVIRIEAVPDAMLLEGDVAYVRLEAFTANASRDLAAAIAAQGARAGGSLRGLILDLRGNSGGLFEQAVQVADLFLSSGVIVTTQGQVERQPIPEVKRAHADRDDLTGLPLVVLVDGGSASASEIVANALRDNERALIVGRRTSGGGLVQVLYQLTHPERHEDLALKLSVGTLVTPAGKTIQDVGVGLDVMLLPACERPAATRDLASRPATVGDGADRHTLRYELHDTAQVCGGGEVPEAFRDPQVGFARDILVRATSGDLDHLRELARAYVAERGRPHGAWRLEDAVPRPSLHLRRTSDNMDYGN